MKVVIVGGGAGGASCAGRLRRLNDSAEIIILEKSNEVSIASCGLPYFVGGVIENRNKMQVASPEIFANLFNVQIKMNTEVVKISLSDKTVWDNSGNCYSYDKLVLATGAAPIVPNIDGLNNLPYFVLKNLADADNIKQFIADVKPRKVAVIGGGFIGVEVAENLSHLGVETSLVEMANQILPPLDFDMAQILQNEMRDNGIKLYLNDGLEKVTPTNIILNSGTKVEADMIVLALGVKPLTNVAQNAGILTNDKGAIITNEYMQTNFEDVYACGDSVAVTDFVSKKKNMIALAGPANRQGRVIADNIAGIPYPYSATQGSGIVKVFNKTGAFTGNNEKQLQNNDIEYHKMLINASSHAGYYPDASELTLKVLYSADGKILGAQAVGKDGVDKRIDVIATVMRLNGSTKDLRDAELCYAPPYSGAKDPVNLVGMAIENVREGLFTPYWSNDFDNMFVLDVRPKEMYEVEHISGAVNIPANQIRNKLNELPKDKTILVHCMKGYTSYVVARILLQNGFSNVVSYVGGWSFYKQQNKNK